MPTLTRSDLDAAIAARLSGFNAQAVEKAAQALFTLMGDGEGSPLDKNALAAFLDSFGMVPAGNVETVSQALIATAAREAGDWHSYYVSAFTVLESQRQAERARGRQGGDALDGLLRTEIARYPRFQPAMFWAEFRRRASSPQIQDEALVSYDNQADTLIFEPHPGADLVDINYAAFRKRYSRIKKSLRHQPASVPLHRDDAQHQQPLKAAA
jgi:hypothetical protein